MMENYEFDEVLTQLKLVTKELALRITAQYQDLTLADVEEHNPIVRDSISIIKKYEGAIFENR